MPGSNNNRNLKRVLITERDILREATVTAPNSGYNNITVAGQERPNPSQAEVNDYWQDDTGVYVIQVRGGRNVWAQAISPSAEAAIPAGIASLTDIENFALVNNPARVPENKIDEVIARTSQIPDVSGFQTESNVRTIIGDNVETFAHVGNNVQVPDNKISDNIARTSAIPTIPDVPSNADIDARILNWLNDGTNRTVLNTILSGSPFEFLSNTDIANAITLALTDYRTEEQIIRLISDNAPSGGGGPVTIPDDVVRSTFIGANADRRARFNSLIQSILSIEDGFEYDVTNLTALTLRTLTALAGRFTYSTTTGNVVLTNNNRIIGNEIALGTITGLHIGDGEIVKRHLSGYTGTDTNGTIPVAAIWAGEDNNDIIPLRKLPDSLHAASASELDIIYDFGTSIFSNVHTISGAPDTSTTSKAHPGNAASAMRFRPVGNVEIFDGEGFLEFRARAENPDGSGQYTDPNPRRITLTGLEKNRRYLATEIQSDDGGNPIEIDFTVLLTDNVDDQGTQIPGVRIQMFSTVTSQDNPPLFGILLVEYAQPVTIEQVHDWALLSNLDPIDLEKVINAYQVRLLSADVTSDDLNNADLGCKAISVLGGPVLDLPVGSYIVRSYELESGNDLLQEAINLSSGLMYNRVRGTGEWSDVNVFRQIAGTGGGGGGEQGPPGPQGDPGPQGEQGPQGDTGPAGPAGQDGADGADGAQGPQGVAGQTGPEGPAGPQGEQGPQGPQGEQGPQGPPGTGDGPGGTPLVVADHYVHIGTPNLSGTETGVVTGTNNINPGNAQDVQNFNVRFDNTIAGYNIPTAGSYNPQNGDIVLPAGHWVVCASLNVYASAGTNMRVAAALSINHGTNERHSQALYLRNDAGQIGADGIAELQGKVSIAGAVISDGVGPVRIRIAVSRQGGTETVEIRGAHVHAYEQLVSAAGPAGPQGIQGPPGAQGQQGERGLQGATGAAGQDGAQGAQGPRGLTGPAGAQGPQGDPGPTGPAGADGQDGQDGAQGQQGERGLTGPAGADGQNGAPGPRGDAGPAGPAGQDGAQGPRGITGPTGPAGNDGAQGQQGPQGDPGPAGARGDTGPAGADGQDGAQGPQGDPGPTGPAGQDGAQGPQGDTGPAGADGADGQGVPAGGTAGQIISKVDSTDYNTAWVDAPTGGGGGADIPTIFTSVDIDATVEALNGAETGIFRFSQFVTANFLGLSQGIYLIRAYQRSNGADIVQEAINTTTRERFLRAQTSGEWLTNDFFFPEGGGGSNPNEIRRINGFSSEINGVESETVSFVITGNPILGLPAGEYILEAWEDSDSGVDNGQRATNYTTNTVYLRHNLSGEWTNSDLFVVQAGGEPIVPAEHHLYIGALDNDSNSASGLLPNTSVIFESSSTANNPSENNAGGVGNAITRHIPFDNTLSHTVLPEGATYSQSTGALILPAGYWQVNLAAHFVSSTTGQQANGRVQAGVAIEYGGDEKASNEAYIRNIGFESSANDRLTGKTSCSTLIHSNGTTPVMLLYRAARQELAIRLAIRTAIVQASEVLIAEVGPQGPAGPDGEQGPQGEAGPAGPQGDTGPAGPQGDTGPAGPTGPRGEQGDPGPQGPAGSGGGSSVFAEPTYDTYVVGAGNDALYRVNFTTYQFERINNVSGFEANVTDPTGLVWHGGELYIADSARRTLVRLDKGDNGSFDGSGTQIGEVNALPAGPQGMVSVDGQLLLTCTDPNTAATTFHTVNPSTAATTQLGGTISGVTNILDMTTTLEGQIFAVVNTSSGSQLAILNPGASSNQVVTIGNFTLNGINRSMYGLFFRGRTLFGISSDIGDDDLFIVNITNGELVELGSDVNFFGVNELLPRGVVAIPHTDLIAGTGQIELFAFIANPEAQVPISKLGNVEEFAQVGNTALVSEDKIPDKRLVRSQFEPVVTTEAVAGPRLYAIDTFSNSGLLVADPLTGSLTSTSLNVSVDLRTAAVLDETVYSATLNTRVAPRLPVLNTYDPATGVSTFIGVINTQVPDFNSVDGITMFSHGGLLYAYILFHNTVTDVSGFYIIDTTTALATRVGSLMPVSNQPFVVSAVSVGTTIYAVHSSDYLATVDITTGVVTRVPGSASGFGRNSGNVVALAYVDGSLYGITSRSGSVFARFVVIDTVTGVASNIGNSLGTRFERAVLFYTTSTVRTTITDYVIRSTDIEGFGGTPQIIQANWGPNVLTGTLAANAMHTIPSVAGSDVLIGLGSPLRYRQSPSTRPLLQAVDGITFFGTNMISADSPIVSMQFRAPL